VTMVRGLVRAAAYLPRYSDGAGRLRAWDEDPVTMAAAAVERVEAVDGPGDGAVTVHVVGSVAGLGAAELASILGTPVRLVPPGTDGDSLGEAIRAASAGAGRHWVVVVAAEGSSSPRRAPPGEGAAALLFADSDRSVPFAAPGNPGSGPLQRFFAASREAGSSPCWIGDWTVEPGRGAPATTRPPPVDRLEATVSQGAFVPGPRDDESRAGRWRFLADRCEACATVTFPPRGRCRGCRRSDRLRPERLPLGGATVVASTWIGPGGQPTEFDLQVEANGGYGVVLAEVAEGIRVTLAVADAKPEEVRVGARVDTVLRRLYPIEGAWRYGRKAIPAVSPGAGAGPHRRGPSR
jgi:uncharacterized OB-fold protein